MDNIELKIKHLKAKGKSPFEGIKTLFDLKHSDIMQALRETREEN